jgi:hypothetical protein
MLDAVRLDVVQGVHTHGEQLIGFQQAKFLGRKSIISGGACARQQYLPRASYTAPHSPGQQHVSPSRLRSSCPGSDHLPPCPFSPC